MNVVLKALTRWWQERQAVKRPVICEYWVFLPGESMPEQDAVMSQMVGSNPFGSPLDPPIGPKEGMLFSDVRLSVGFVLRSKNPHAFRPDLLSEHAEPTPQILEGLAASKSFLRLRYLSTVPLQDDRHLTFMPHLAAAYARLAKGKVVYDASAQWLMTADEFAKRLAQDPKAAGPSAHLHIGWSPSEHGGVAETFGLSKVGLPELRTLECHVDQRVLASEVVREAAEYVWKSREVGESVAVRCFDDEYKLEIQPTKSGPYRVRIHRFDQVG